MLRVALVAAALLAVFCASAQAQSPPVRLAAPSDCERNPNCVPGFRRAYGLDPAGLPGEIEDRRRRDPGARRRVGRGRGGVLVEPAALAPRPPGAARRQAHDRAGPRRPGREHVAAEALRAGAAAPAERRLAAAHDAALRGLNQQVIDGRLPEAVGGEFIDANGLGGDPARRRAGPRIVVGFQDFAENETLAYMYAAALRGAGFRVTVRSVGGLRPQTVSALRRGRIGIWPGYSGSLRGYLGGRSLTRALARIGAAAARARAGAGPQHLCDEVGRRARAGREQALGPGAVLAEGRRVPHEDGARGARRRSRASSGLWRPAACSTCPAPGSSHRAPASPSPCSTAAPSSITRTWRRTSGRTSARSPATAPTTTATASSTTSTASI